MSLICWCPTSNRTACGPSARVRAEAPSPEVALFSSSSPTATFSTTFSTRISNLEAAKVLPAYSIGYTHEQAQHRRRQLPVIVPAALLAQVAVKLRVQFKKLVSTHEFRARASTSTAKSSAHAQAMMSLRSAGTNPNYEHVQQTTGLRKPDGLSWDSQLPARVMKNGLLQKHHLSPCGKNDCIATRRHKATGQNELSPATGCVCQGNHSHHSYLLSDALQADFCIFQRQLRGIRVEDVTSELTELLLTSCDTSLFHSKFSQATGNLSLQQRLSPRYH